MADNHITLGSGHVAALESAGNTYNVRHIHGTDRGLFPNVSIHPRKPTLTVSSTGEDALVDIPFNASEDPRDFIPRLVITGTHPVHVNARTFILDSTSSQAALAASSREGASKLSIAENKDKNGDPIDKRYAAGDRVVYFHDPRGEHKTVILKPGGGELQIFDFRARDKESALLLTLSGKDSLGENKADIAKFLETVKDTQPQKPEASKPVVVENPVVAVQRREALAKIRDEFNQLKQFPDAQMKPFYKRNDFKPVFDEVQNNLAAMLKPDGSPDPEKRAAFYASIDKLIDMADNIAQNAKVPANKPRGNLLKQKLEVIAESVNQVDGLKKISMLPEEAREAARNAVAGASWTNQPIFDPGDATNKVSNLNTPGTGRSPYLA